VNWVDARRDGATPDDDDDEGLPMRNRHRRGFTLVELLVVIGIIALLIGILIPVVSRVRQAAYGANTRSLLQKISAACSSYQLTFNAYPGIMPNAYFPGAVGSFFTDPSYKNFTQSEDLVVSLAGGLKTDATGKFDFDATYLGQGPTNFNPLNPGKAHSAFISADPNDLSPKDAAGHYTIATNNELNQPFVQDSPAPEFMDKFPDPRPIIYVRANRGTTSGSIISPGYAPAFAYNYAAVSPYLNKIADDPAEVLAQPPAVPNVPTDPTVKYFTSEQSTTSAKFAGTYILISAGPDRKFGTADDIIMGGGGGQ
jgi:prepilin-type N-terminal cleavage/methylation domain-containing protein